MIEKLLGPEGRIDDFKAILQGRNKVEGWTSFGKSTIHMFHGDYVVDVSGDTPGMRMYFVIDTRGEIQSSGRYFELEPGMEGQALSLAEKAAIDKPILFEDNVVDEGIISFQESICVDPHDKELAMEEMVEAIVLATRDNVIGIARVTPDFCSKRPTVLKPRKTKVMPSASYTLSEADLKNTIALARYQLKGGGDGKMILPAAS